MNNWLLGINLPRDLNPIERAHFGDNSEFSEWKANLRLAFVSATSDRRNRTSEARDGGESPPVKDSADDREWRAFAQNTLKAIVRAQLFKLYPGPDDFRARMRKIKDRIESLGYQVPNAWIDDANDAIRFSTKDSLGTLSKPLALLGAAEPIRVAIPVIMLGSAAIFFALRNLLGDAVTIEATFPHAANMANLAKKGWEGMYSPPELIVVGDGPSLVMHEERRGGYRIVSLMPPCEQRIVVPRIGVGKATSIPTDFFLPLQNDFPTTPYAYLRRFMLGLKALDDQALVELEPSDAVKRISEGAQRSDAFPLWSPHWQFLAQLGLGTSFAQVPNAGEERDGRFDRLREKWDQLEPSGRKRLSAPERWTAS